MAADARKEQLYASLNRLQEISDSLGDPDKPLTPERLQDLFGHISTTVADALKLAGQQVVDGMSKVEAARKQLSDQDLHEDAQTLDPLLEELGAAQTQIHSGLMMARDSLSTPADQTPVPRDPRPRDLDEMERLEAALAEVDEGDD